MNQVFFHEWQEAKEGIKLIMIFKLISSTPSLNIEMVSHYDANILGHAYNSLIYINLQLLCMINGKLLGED